MQRRPDREARWTLFAHTFRKDDNGDDVLLQPPELKQEKSCLAGYLSSIGVTAEVSPDDERIVVESSFGQIGSVLQLAAVQSYELSCSASECARCEDLPEQACRADPFCWPLEAIRRAAERSCSDRRFAGCMRSDITCGDAITMATGADGACWQFSSTCVPEGFAAAGAGCDDGAIEAERACDPR